MNFKEQFFDFCIKFDANLMTARRILEEGITPDTHDIYAHMFNRVFETPVQSMTPKFNPYRGRHFSFDCGTFSQETCDSSTVFAVTPKNHIQWFRVIRESYSKNFVGKMVLNRNTVGVIGCTEERDLKSEFDMYAFNNIGYGGDLFPDSGWSWQGMDIIIKENGHVLKLEAIE